MRLITVFLKTSVGVHFVVMEFALKAPRPHMGSRLAALSQMIKGPPTSPPCLSHFHYDLRLFLNYPVWESYSIDINAF